MATATARWTEKLVTKVETVQDGVTLHLNAEEAKFLRAVVARIGGDPKVSRRRFADSIRNALHEAGVEHDYRTDGSDISQGMTFEETA